MEDRSWGRSGSGRGSISDSRGQTLQDFTIGIGLFLVVTAAVLAGFFGYLEPFSVDVESEDVSESTRIAETTVQNLSREQAPNELNASRTQATFTTSETVLRQRWGLRNSTNFNVTVETLDSSAIVRSGGQKLAVGTTYENRSAGLVTRIITMTNGKCEPGCRLTVRIW